MDTQLFVIDPDPIKLLADLNQMIRWDNVGSIGK